MALPATNHPLELYACIFEDVKRFKQKHVLAATVALFACALIGLFSYYLLTNNTMGVNLGPNLNIAASVIAGSVLLSIAITGILIHYGYNISEKDAAASEEHFLQALTHPRTIALLEAIKHGKDEWAWERFKAMLTLNFPEENWQGMMRYFDNKFYRQSDCIYAKKTQNQVFDIFLYADPMRFIFNYVELNVQDCLHLHCKDLLNNKLGKVYGNFTVDQWKTLVKAFDKRYADHPCYAKLKQQLLNDLKKTDSTKFKAADLEPEDNLPGVNASATHEALPFSRNFNRSSIEKKKRHSAKSGERLVVSD